MNLSPIAFIFSFSVVVRHKSDIWTAFLMRKCITCVILRVKTVLMKKILLCLIVAVNLLMNSCTRQERAIECYSANRLIPIETGSKTTMYYISCHSGHTASDCGGKCVSVNGHDYHFNCMGYGNVCRQLTSVALQQVGTAITATTTDTFDLTSEDFFLMPDRSLDYVDEKGSHIFLNIPEQMVYRDTATLQFTFTGLFFSEIAAYSNN